ncbi:MAG: hypothetical protein KF703_04500 [Actinobacteria bacterium]|nr:hypothetical protein [Actinomycetota bacterium]
MPVAAPVPVPDLAALRLLGDRVRPLAGAGERTLAVPPPLADLLPHRGLQRGSTVATTGTVASTLALALAGPTTRAGSWAAVVGLHRLGLVAAAELGVDLERVLLVAEPAPDAWPATVAALLDAVDVVLVRPARPVGVSVQRRLTARARDRGSVLLQVGGHLGAWAQAPDLVVAGTTATWVGLGQGHGRLRGRQVEVAVSGRRGADRPRRALLWLPGPDGGLAPVEEPARTSPHPHPSPRLASHPDRSGSPVLREVG